MYLDVKREVQLRTGLARVYFGVQSAFERFYEIYIEKVIYHSVKTNFRRKDAYNKISRVIVVRPLFADN